MRNPSTGFFAIILLLLAFSMGTSFYDASHLATVSNCKVLRLEQQTRLKGSKGNVHTEIRYLVITDRETFICESSLWNAKFNNSDLFFHLQQGQTYTFRVAGIGKNLFTDYRNILEVTAPR